MSGEARKYKDVIYEQFALVGKALASAPRLEILDLLLQADRSVEALAGEAHLTLANTSHHLQILKQARLVEAERHGHFICYRVSDDSVFDLVRSMRSFGKRRLSEIEHAMREFIEDHDALEPVDAEGLALRMQSEDCVIIDVRPLEEYEAGHLAGAISVPLREIVQRLAELPRDRGIVAYCRSPFCVLAVEAAEILRSHGFDAVCVRAGMLEWKAGGMALIGGVEGNVAVSGSKRRVPSPAAFRSLGTDGATISKGLDLRREPATFWDI